ncbi:MAG TPA: hypothetical protein VFS21_21590 [Roseiflexaceae bacterium]|nr:hypothetical protein [Roseiflexaceae bacterium]
MRQLWMALLCCALLMAGPASGPPAQAADGSPSEQVVTLGGTLWTMAADGQRVYLVEGASLVVLDMTDPVAPRPLGRVPLANDPTALEAADGAYAYLAMGLNGLRIVRIDPSAFPRPVYLPMVTAAE